MQAILPLRGFVQHYEWGGYHLIPDLLGIENTKALPYAELWLGAHPKGPARVWADGQWTQLDQLLSQEAEPILGAALVQRFGGLPYLLKVLDVRKMLSIQVHPNLSQAKEGFEREEQAGIPADAPHRNYRDRNHKPESMVALTDFWLLHGFRPLAEIANSLDEVPGWQALKPLYQQAGLPALYAHIMRAPQQEIDELLQPLYLYLLDAGELQRQSPHYWAKQAFLDYTSEGHFDRGIFSIYWFNLVYLAPGQGIFQAAGVPHAYLEGANMELMANSDNVLRGGLTPKYIDTEELLDKMHLAPVNPLILLGEAETASRVRYPAPIDDYIFDRIRLAPGEQANSAYTGPAVYFVGSGTVAVGDQTFGRGASFLAVAGAEFVLQAQAGAPAELYCASCS